MSLPKLLKSQGITVVDENLRLPLPWLCTFLSAIGRFAHLNMKRVKGNLTVCFFLSLIISVIVAACCGVLKSAWVLLAVFIGLFLLLQLVCGVIGACILNIPSSCSCMVVESTLDKLSSFCIVLLPELLDYETYLNTDGVTYESVKDDCNTKFIVSKRLGTIVAVPFPTFDERFEDSCVRISSS